MTEMDHRVAGQSQLPGEHVGPFKVRGETAWLFPSGVIVLSLAIASYVWLVADVLLSRPLACDIEDQHVRAVGLITAGGFACLMASTAERPRTQLSVGLVTGLIAGISGAAIVVLLYGTQCIPFRMYVRQMV